MIDHAQLKCHNMQGEIIQESFGIGFNINKCQWRMQGVGLHGVIPPS